MISMEFAKEIIKGSLVRAPRRGAYASRCAIYVSPWCEPCAVGTESVSRDNARVRAQVCEAASWRTVPVGPWPRVRARGRVSVAPLSLLSVTVSTLAETQTLR